MCLRIAHVVRQFHPSVGGMEDVVRTLAQHQREDYGHDASVITLNRVFRQSVKLPDVDTIDGVPVRRLKYFGSERYPVCLSVLKPLRDVDVVHVHGVDFFFDFLAWTRWHHRRPLIASTHGGFFHTTYAQGLKNIFFNTVTRASSLGYRRVIATSDSDGEIFSRVVHGERLVVIENGVNITKFASICSPCRRPVLLYFGRWSSNKGLAQLFDLFRLLRQADGRWRLIVAGREYDHSADELQRWVDALNIREAVTIVPNPDDARLRQLIHDATYYISLSQHEGFGLAPVEAMSAGLIPLLSAIPPHQKLASEAGIARILGNDPQQAVQEILAEHHKDGVSYEKDKINAKQFAQRFSWASVVARYEREYQLACPNSLRWSQ